MVVTEKDVGEASQVTYHLFAGNFTFSSIYFPISYITFIICSLFIYRVKKVKKRWNKIKRRWLKARMMMM
ncbi:hypothetical protein GIB67_010136, partial [Kingdonia uniflora]